MAGRLEKGHACWARPTDQMPGWRRHIRRFQAGQFQRRRLQFFTVPKNSSSSTERNKTKNMKTLKKQPKKKCGRDKCCHVNERQPEENQINVTKACSYVIVVVVVAVVVPPTSRRVTRRPPRRPPRGCSRGWCFGWVGGGRGCGLGGGRDGWQVAVVVGEDLWQFAHPVIAAVCQRKGGKLTNQQTSAATEATQAAKSDNMRQYVIVSCRRACACAGECECLLLYSES